MDLKGGIRMEKMKLSEFTEHIILGNKPFIGGGSIAALCGSLSASLLGLVSSISFDGLDEEKKEHTHRNSRHLSRKKSKAFRRYKK